MKLDQEQWEIFLDNYMDTERSTRLKFVKVIISVADQQKKGVLIDRKAIAYTLYSLFK
jgi:hypothetical protein